MSGTDRSVEVGGLRLHYVEHGDAADLAIVCLHGGGAGLSMSEEDASMP